MQPKVQELRALCGSTLHQHEQLSIDDSNPFDEADRSRSVYQRFTLFPETPNFYRPIRIPTLHAAIYPGEYFNHASSAGKVLNVLWRLREWCRAQGVGLQIEYRGNLVSISDASTCALLVANPDARAVLPRGLEHLHEACKGAEFKVRDALNVLGGSRRTLQRTLRRATEAGILQREGGGAHAKYRFRE